MSSELDLPNANEELRDLIDRGELYRVLLRYYPARIADAIIVAVVRQIAQATEVE